MFFFFIYKYMNMIFKELVKFSYKFKFFYDRFVYINLYGIKGY